MNVRKDFVSIITPAYNGEHYIHRLLDSVLMQDYPFIEMFTIDDGSTDKTKQIIESYIPKFLKRGYELTYIYQDNAGQAAAVNMGLKLATGEFLTWPDSDDYYRCSYSISLMVRCLSFSNGDYGLVRCQCRFIEEDTHIELDGEICYTDNTSLFMPYINGEEYGGGAGLYMVKAEALDKTITGRDIYTKRSAQNCQLLLPMFYSYKCKTIRERLINILVRRTSHSRAIKSYEELLDVIQGYTDIYMNTINRIRPLSDDEKEKYLHLINLRFLNDSISLALNFAKYKDARMFARQYLNLGGTLKRGRQVKLWLSRFSPLLRIINWLQKKLPKLSTF